MAGDDGRAVSVAILKDLEEVAGLLILDRAEPPVIEKRGREFCAWVAPKVTGAS